MTAAAIKSERYRFTAPLGPVELEDIRWYIEKYYQWPTGVFKQRAERTETNLPQWGQLLYRQVLADESTRSPLEEWRRKPGSRRFSVQVDDKPISGTPDDEAARFREAANDLLTLPWEILHDSDGYLSQGANGVRVRRRLPNRKPTTTLQSRPAHSGAADQPPPGSGWGRQPGRLHRPPHQRQSPGAGGRDLGEDLVKVDLLSPPTFPAMKAALQRASDENDPYEIVHFDGHGVYDRQVGLGALCFEDPRDATSWGSAC
jgi:hypothetical protein